MDSATGLALYWDEPLETALGVLAEGIASIEQMEAAVIERRQRRPAIGQIAIKHRKLTMAQVFRILEHQAATGKRFGEIALELGFLKADDLYELLQLQGRMTPSLAEVLVDTAVVSRDQLADVQTRIEERLRTPTETSDCR
jgi:hypothetical protein